MFDGNAVSNISLDIEDMFDPTRSTYVGDDVSGFASFYDVEKGEYHWLTSDREMVYDLIRKKWYEINRGTGKHLVSGWTVTDVYGNQYNYGGTADGFIERLEYGNTMDGNSIAYSFWLGDIPLSKSAIYESELRKEKLTGVGKATTTQTVAVTHYADMDTTGTSIGTVDPTVSKRCFQKVLSQGKNATFHGLKFTISTNNEALGFEPLVVSVLYRVIRPDMF
jgi:hypothetical protein